MFTKDGVFAGEWGILLCFIMQSFNHAKYEVCARKKLHRDFIRMVYEVYGEDFIIRSFD